MVLFEEGRARSAEGMGEEGGLSCGLPLSRHEESWLMGAEWKHVVF